jgi:ElaB/YqjD/DUF883 family membrane-anchored ribosome-binding protein
MAQSTYEKSKSSVEDLASHAAEKASATAKEAGDSVRHYADKATDKVEQTVHDYPLAAIAGAAVLGLVIGTMLRR